MNKNPPSESQAQQDDVASIHSIDRPPPETPQASPAYHPLSPQVLALLIPASIFGTLARLGLEALATYDGQSIFPLAYVQATGCLLMGFLLGLKEPFGRFYAPLYTSLTTGFCGSLTTFSGWQLDVFSSWINAGQAHRGGLRDFVDGMGKTVFTLSLSLGSVAWGTQLARLVSPHLPKIPSPTRPVRWTLTILSILCYAATIPAYLRLSTGFRHQATAALLFAFPGTLTRYILSIYLNPLVQLIPLGTLTANSVGTALLGTFHVLQSIQGPVSHNACALLQGLSDGYCGCLTTVSTFAVEVRLAKGWRGFWYALVSWTLGQVLLLVILGPSYWSGDISEQIKCTFD